MKPKYYKIPFDFDDLFNVDASDYQKRKSAYLQLKKSQSLIRSVDEHIELLLTTHMGEYKYDHDFGFVIWQREFENMEIDKFNTHSHPKQEIEESIKKTLAKFEPRLKKVEIDILFVYKKLFKGKSIKYFVDVTVRGVIVNNIETEYAKKFQFAMGPLYM